MPVTFHLPPLNVLLALASSLLGLLLLGLVLRWLRAGTSLGRLVRYFGHSFEDARDRPDGKLLTLFSLTGAVLVCFAVGLLTRYWPPDYIWISTLAFLAAGYGFSAQELRAKIKAEGEVKQASLTGQPVPGASASSATTTTTTTLDTE